jgi:hypothetical protein
VWNTVLFPSYSIPVYCLSIFLTETTHFEVSPGKSLIHLLLSTFTIPAHGLSILHSSSTFSTNYDLIQTTNNLVIFNTQSKSTDEGTRLQACLYSLFYTVQLFNDYHNRFAQI